MPPFSQLIQNRAIQIALAVVGLILVGSVSYYLIESAPPKVAYASVTTGSITEDVTATGTVSPVQNPVLSFEQSGQVTAVTAMVGKKVAAGTLLASLDTSVLSASLSAAQAQLNLLEAGPRAVDVAGQQTGLTNAQTALNNLYANYPQTLLTTFTSAQGVISTDVDGLFNTSTANDPVLNFVTKNYNTRVVADSERAALTGEFAAWQAELTAAGSNPSPAELKTLTQSSVTHLNSIQHFLNDLSLAVQDANPGTVFTSAQQSAAEASIATANNTINGLVTSLNSTTQSVTNAQIAVQSATDQLNQVTAGATTQAIQAQQAQVAGIEAQIHQLQIVAPFAGTIGSVSIKRGDPVSANTPAVTLIPDGNFEVDVYLAENQVAGLKTGDAADITLDAYGTGRIFPATVSSIDTSPSAEPGVAGATGYKVTLIFTNADPAISNGMHANVTIHAGSAENVLLVPKTAVITDGAQSYVLQKTSDGLVKAPVTTGLSDTDSVQIVSGLAAGDTISAVGSQ